MTQTTLQLGKYKKAVFYFILQPIYFAPKYSTTSVTEPQDKKQEVILLVLTYQTHGSGTWSCWWGEETLPVCWWSAVGQDGGPGSVAAAQDDQSLHRGGVPAGRNTNCQILSFAISPKTPTRSSKTLSHSLALQCIANVWTIMRIWCP